MSINLFEPHYRVDECLAEIRPCLESGWTGAGEKVLEFEQAWREYTGLYNAHMVNSATAGLQLALRLITRYHSNDRRDDGKYVITTPLTFVSTNHAILHEGLTPVFADVDEYLCLDPDSVEKLITDQTVAVMFVGLGGNAGQLDRIAEICFMRNIALILDAAHMAGTRLDGQHVGEEADVTVFSFQSVKNLPTADAGMVCFSESWLDAEARQWSWLGIDRDTHARTEAAGNYRWKYDVKHIGFKAHSNAIMAALGLAGLRYLDMDNSHRRQVAGWYDEALEGAPGIERVPIAPGCQPSRHLYQVMVDDRDRVILALNERDIYPGVHYRDNTEYWMYEGDCPRARRASDRLISLPMHVNLDRRDVYRVATALKEEVG